MFFVLSKLSLRGGNKFTKALFNNRYGWLGAGIAVLVMLFVLMCYKIYPFGDITILRMDLYHQYGPLYAELYDKFAEGGSLFYSWNSGLGGAFLGNLLNYCSSPFAIVMLLAGHYHMPGAIAAMITLKAALAAWTFAYFLRKSFDKNDFSVTAFSLIYTFSGWFIAYYWDIMWVDAFAVFPLVILGIEYIVNGKKPWLFTLSLAYIAFTNYYMAYMTVIMSVLYFIYYYFGRYGLISKLDPMLKGKRIVYVDDDGNEVVTNAKPGFFDVLRNSRFLVRGATFAFAGVLAGLLSVCALLPVAFTLQTSSATGGTWPSTYKLYFGVLDFIANHFASLEPTIRSSGENVLPNIYCGMLSMLLVPLYFFCSKIDFRQKIATSFMLVLFYFSFTLNYLNYVWHGMHFPNDLPYRWSFMYSFFLLLLAYSAFVHLRTFRYQHIVGVGIAVALVVAIVQKTGSKNVGDGTVYTSLAFIVVMTLLLVIMQNRRWRKTSLELFLMCAVIIEIVVANSGHYVASQSKTAYAGDWQSYQDVRELTEELDADLFYRTELTGLRARMDPCWYNYHGASTFSSMAYEPVAKLARKLGMYGNNINSYTYNPQTVIFNSMHAIKYLYDKTKDDFIKSDYIYERKMGDDTWTSYAYKYYLPIAYAVSPALLSWNTDATTPIDVQNGYISSAVGIDDVLVNIPIESAEYDNLKEFSQSELDQGSMSYTKINTGNDYCDVTFHFTMPKTQRLYIYIDCRDLKNASFVSDSYTGTRNFDEPMILDIGDFKEGEDVAVTLSINDSNSGKIKFRAAGLDIGKYTEAFNTIVSNGVISLTDFSDTHIKGTITVANGARLLYTSIPYDEGWTVTVDGEKAELRKIGGAYLGVTIGDGFHEVEFKYTPRGLYLGWLVSGTTILLIAAFVILYKKKLFIFSDSFKAKYAPPAQSYEL